MFWNILFGIIGLILIIGVYYSAYEKIRDEMEGYSSKTKKTIIIALIITLIMYLIADGLFGLLTFFVIILVIPFPFGIGAWLIEEMDDPAWVIIGKLLYFKTGLLILLLFILPFCSLFANDVSLSEFWSIK